MSNLLSGKYSKHQLVSITKRATAVTIHKASQEGKDEKNISNTLLISTKKGRYRKYDKLGDKKWLDTLLKEFNIKKEGTKYVSELT